MDFIRYKELLYIFIYKIEEIENLLQSVPSKHIPAYHKILGLQQKIETLPIEYKEHFFEEMIQIRGIIVYFMNGRYNDGINVLLNIKNKLNKISNENNKNTNI